MSDFVGYAGLLASVFLLIWLALTGHRYHFCRIGQRDRNHSDQSTGLRRIAAFRVRLGQTRGFYLCRKVFFTLCGRRYFWTCHGRLRRRRLGGPRFDPAYGRRKSTHRYHPLLRATNLRWCGGICRHFRNVPSGASTAEGSGHSQTAFLCRIGAGGWHIYPDRTPRHPINSKCYLRHGAKYQSLCRALAWHDWWHHHVCLGAVVPRDQRRLAHDRAEGFEPGPRDQLIDVNAEPLPHWVLALSPLVVVLGTIMLPRLFLAAGVAVTGSAAQLLEFANNQPVVWPSIALLLGSVQAALLFPRVRYRALLVMGQGTQDAILPLINTSAVIGFAGVVTQTQGFQTFLTLAVDSGLPPLLSVFGSISLISAITGSASGGLQIFMQTLGPQYLEMGLEPEVLHRVATIASGGFDSLPHCGAVVAMLTITQLTHKQAYRDVGMITVVIPVIATLVTIGAASLGIR
jgi:hypothetical protein